MVLIGRSHRHWLHVAALGLVALLLAFSWASAGPQVDESPKTQNPSTNHAQGTKTLAPAPGTQNVPATKPEAKPDQQAPKKDGDGIELGSWPDWVIVAFTAFLAWLSWRQHELEKRLASDTADSLAIAKQAADAATLSAQASDRHASAYEEGLRTVDRAYVFGGVEDIVLDPATGAVSLNVTIANMGKTPARVRTLKLGIRPVGLGPPDFPEIRDYGDAELFNTDTIYPAGCNEKPLPREGLPAFGIIYGEIEYDDIFKVRHHSRFCLYYSGIEARCNTFGSESWNEYD